MDHYALGQGVSYVAWLLKAVASLIENAPFLREC
jgi:hypothetical protein